ncbi:MAG: hypothetical protein R3C01_12195 [Planctomycetaceae bacterium]
MKHYPSFEQFQSLANEGKLVPVYRTLLSDTLTAVSAYHRCGWTGPSFLFESVVGGEKVGRFSFLGGDPFLRIDAFGNRIVLTEHGQVTEREVADPLVELQSLVNDHPAIHLPGLPRFCGGAVGYAGYDVIRYTENLPNSPEDDRHLPDLSFAFYDRMVIFDNIQKTIMVVAHARTDTGNHLAEYELACARVDELCWRLQHAEDDLEPCDIEFDRRQPPQKSWKSNFTQPEFEQAVSSCQEYIRAGTSFKWFCHNG